MARVRSLETPALHTPDMICWDKTLPATEIDALAETLAASPARLAPVLRKRRQIEDAEARNCFTHTVSEQIVQRIVGLLTPYGQQAASVFGLTAALLRDIDCLRYGPGCFFRLHQDNSTEPRAPAIVRHRQISLVLFLTGRSVMESNRWCSGGALVVHPRLGGKPNVVVPHPARLVAFRSECYHEVRPVLEGTRMTIVAWLRGT